MIGKIFAFLALVVSVGFYIANQQYRIIGHHVQKDKDNNIYSGQFFFGKRHGKGVLRYANNNCSYRGDFSENQIEGQGEFDCKGTYYKGGMHKGQYHGQGQLQWNYGHVYEGAFSSGKFDGRGTLYHSVNRHQANYTGDFEAGKKSGYGLMRLEDGSIWKGWHKNDAKELKRCNYYLWSTKRSYSVGGEDECSKKWQKNVEELEKANAKDPKKKVRHGQVEALFYYPDFVCDCDAPQWDMLPPHFGGSPLGEVKFVLDPEEEEAIRKREADAASEIFG